MKVYAVNKNNSEYDNEEYSDQGDWKGMRNLKGKGNYPNPVNNFQRHNVIADTSGNGSSLAPAQHGPRSLYKSHQPGSSRWTFEPETEVFNFITNKSVITVTPQNSNPGNDSQIVVIMEQQPCLFYDSSTFFLEFEAEMFYKEQP